MSARWFPWLAVALAVGGVLVFHAATAEAQTRPVSRTDQIEAEAQASVELSGAIEGSDLESQFAALEDSSVVQDDALADLKAKMGLAAPPAAAALPAAATVTAVSVESEAEAEVTDDAAIEAELEALLRETS